jgi:hypothetical protein
VDGTHYAMHSQVPYSCPFAHMYKTHPNLLYDYSHALRLRSPVRCKAAFLLNSLLIHSAPAVTTRTTGTRIQDGPAQSRATVHPNSHASMVADPMSADTALEMLRAVHVVHRLLQ